MSDVEQKLQEQLHDHQSTLDELAAVIDNLDAKLDHEKATSAQLV